MTGLNKKCGLKSCKHWIQATVHSEDGEAWWFKHHDMWFILTLRWRIFHISGNMERFENTRILEEVNLPLKDMPLKWVFQQDDHPKHTSKRTKLRFQKNKIQVMWSAQSLDLNSIQKADIKMLFMRQNQEMLNSCGIYYNCPIPADRCQTLVDSMYWKWSSYQNLWLCN